MSVDKSGRPRLVVALAIGIAVLVIPSFVVYVLVVRGHPMYPALMKTLQDTAAITAVMGKPIEPDFLFYARVWHGRGLYELGATGPRGKARIRAVAQRDEDGTWRFLYIRVTPEGPGRPLTLRRQDLAGIVF